MKYRAFVLGLTYLMAVGMGVGVAQAQKLRLPSSGPSVGVGAGGMPEHAPVSAPEGVRQADYIVAVVNSEPLTNNEVRSRIVRVQHSIAAQGASMPARDVLAREVLERLILEKILLQQARDMGVRVDDYAVNQAEQNVARQNDITVKQLHQRLRADGLEPQKFREELRQQMMVQRLRERELDSRVRVSDAEVEQYLQEQANATAATGTSFMLNLGHILVAVPENATTAAIEAAQSRATQAAHKLRTAGADLATLAREYSDATEAKQGGQLGLRPADRYPELFIDALGSAGAGAVIGPLRSPAGFHILKVIERSNAGLPAVVMQQHARHILLRPHADMSETAAAQRLADYRRRIVDGQATFEALAREHSQDGSAKEGGDLGWAAPGRYVPEFEHALAALQPGEISAPVASRFGVHLIELVQRREVPLSARERHDLARDAVREKKLEEAYVTWTQEQRARAYVEYREAPQ